MWIRSAGGSCRSTTRLTSAMHSRFNRVDFEDDASREVARKRLLNAAKKYRIVPVGFITGQLQSERASGAIRAKQAVQLPSGFVTMLMTDMEGSTALVQRLGDGYSGLIDDVRAILRGAALNGLGHVVESRADDFFAVFERPLCAIETAVAIQRELVKRTSADGIEVLVRVGIHSGYPTLHDANYIGLAVHTTARISRGRPRRTDHRLRRHEAGAERIARRRPALQKPRRASASRSTGCRAALPDRSQGTPNPLPPTPHLPDLTVPFASSSPRR